MFVSKSTNLHISLQTRHPNSLRPELAERRSDKLLHEPADAAERGTQGPAQSIRV